MTPFKRILSYFTPVKKGTDASPDPEGLGRSAYRDLTKHGSNVNSDHLPFSQALGTFGVYDRPPPPGSIVVGIPANQADGYIFPLGILSGIHDSSSAGQQLGHLQKAAEQELNIRIPPNVQSVLESNETGIEKWTKRIMEKGIQFKQSLLNGLPSDNTSYELAGMDIEPISAIQGAKDAGIMAMTSEKLSLAGFSTFNLAEILNQLIDLDIGNMTTSMAMTLRNAATLMQQDINAQPSWGAMAGQFVNPATVLVDARNRMNAATSSVEVMDVIRGIQTTNYSPEEKTITISTPYGEIKQNVSSNGTITQKDTIIQDVISALQSLLGTIEQGASGQPLFSESGTQLTEMAGRFKDIDKQVEMNAFLSQLSDSMNTRKKRGRKDGTVGGNTQASRKQIVDRRSVTAIDGAILSFKPVDRSGV